MSQAENMPLVSIITPVYNGSNYIEELILSVKSQDYPYIEHIIIDDGSTDGNATVAILKRYPHLHWWGRENRGQYATMNEGLDAAQGEIICFISADDVMEQEAVKLAVQYLLDNPDKHGVYGDHEYINSEGEPLHPVRPFRKTRASLYPYSLHISHSSLYLRKRFLIDNALYFDASLRYVGDYDWIVRILRHPFCLGQIHQSLSLLRQHLGQTSHLSFFAMREEALRTHRRLGVSAIWASLFRKIMFLSGLLTVARASGLMQAFALLIKRLK